MGKISFPEILLPAFKNTEDWQRWAVVACDQFTSQPSYWEEAEKIVGDAPSALRLILPEIYLEEPDADVRIAAINSNMNAYLENGVFDEPVTGPVLVERSAGNGVRLGLMACLDLEEYNYSADSASLVRATEGTVTSRIPPRMKIRKNASLELPHVLVLIDDPAHRIIEPLAECQSRVLYDFDLMLGGGHVKGLEIVDGKAAKAALEALNSLDLLAVGDGNHSLASAKCHWEELKKAGAGPDHPARYAMVEIENIHDPAIVFEPIHRVLFNVDPYVFFDEMEGFYLDKAAYMEAVTEIGKAPEYPGCHTVLYRAPGHSGFIFIDREVHELAVGALQAFLDDFLARHTECCIDYIHGDETVTELARQKGNMGFYLPPIDKGSFFNAIRKNGPMPRKTFSMGEAREKRYYIECRKIGARG